MAIPQAYRDNFQTLLRAANNGDLALIETTDAVTNEPRYVICAMSWNDIEAQYIMTPFGHLCPDDPYEVYVDPIQALDAGTQGE
jgi:hypothetical protein